MGGPRLKIIPSTNARRLDPGRSPQNAGRLILFWPEARRGIGMGHLAECAALAEELRRKGLDVLFLIQAYSPARAFLEKRRLPFVSMSFSAKAAAAAIRKTRPRAIVVHHRAVELATLKTLKTGGATIAVIDQLGGRRIAADLLINSSPVERWHRYSCVAPSPLSLFGVRFAILRSEFSTARRAAPSPAMRRKILVSMGGIDRTGATVRIVRALGGLDVDLDVVVGAGFTQDRELADAIAAAGRARIRVGRNVTDMARRLARARLLISAGGNTLLEAAAVGTPTLVLWEDPHERVQGKACERLGFARCLGNGVTTPEGRIRSAAAALLDAPARLTAMSRAGKRCVDGKGVRRLVQALARRVPSS